MWQASTRNSFTAHQSYLKKKPKTKRLSLFEKVKLPDVKRTYTKYPHEISGGQKQRVMIAMAIACKPDVLIADEPTTALDVTVQKDIIKLLKELQAETKMSIIFITHDLALISEIANHVLVMFRGNLVEEGLVKTIFKNPQHNYTKALINSRPSLDTRLKTLPTIKDFLEDTTSTEIVTDHDRQVNHEKIYSQTPLLEVINVEKEYLSSAGFFTKATSFKAVNNVSFKLYPGETLGLVGESGCGKSTLGNAILQLDKATAGQILYNGIDITKLDKTETRKLRKDIQIIFQDPYSSLNPRMPVGEAIMEPMKVHGLFNSTKERKEKVIDILNRVGYRKIILIDILTNFLAGSANVLVLHVPLLYSPNLLFATSLFLHLTYQYKHRF